MKKLSILFVLGILAIVLATATHAAASLNMSTVAIGSDSQQRDVNASRDVTVYNNGNETISNLTFSTTASSAYNTVFSGACVGANLTLGTNCVVKVTAYVPKTLNAIDDDFNAYVALLGTITVSGTGADATTPTKTVNYTMQAENALSFDEVQLIVDGDPTDLEDGDDIEDLKPLDKFTIDVTMANEFDNNDYDYTVEDVTVAVKIDDPDFDIDDDDKFDLDAEETDTASFKDLVVDKKASGNYDLVISALGTDENGALHGVEMTVTVKIDRESHEFIITKAMLTKPTVQCIDGVLETSDVKITVTNIGKKDEDEGSVDAAISALKVLATKSAIKLNSDSSATYTVTLSLPNGTKTGNYDVDVKAYPVSDAETDSTSLSLTVEGCAATAAATTATATTATTTTGTTAVTATAPTARITSKTPFTETNTYMYVLGGIVVVLLGSTLWIGIKLAALAK